MKEGGSPYDAYRTSVSEATLTSDLEHKIRISCHIKVAEIAGIITTLAPLLRRALALAEEINSIEEMKKPGKDAAVEDIKRYDEIAFNGKNRSKENRKQLVEGWIDRWVVLKGDIETAIKGKEHIVNKPFNEIIKKTVYSACNFNVTNSPVEIEIDDDSNPIPIDELKTRYDGIKYALIHASSWAEGLDLKLMIAFFIRRSNNLLGNPDRENGSIYQYIWDGEGGMSNIKGIISQLIVKCDKNPSSRISREYQRKIGC